MELRPVCPGCGEKLRPFIHGGYELPREWHGTYRGYGAFCSLVCTEGYANYMYKKHGTMLIMVKK